MQFPVKKMKLLYHVGDMDCQPAPQSRHSQEGPCLSVSRVPQAWRIIAQLGQAPVWVLRKADGAFLDMLRLDVEAKAAILEWGYASGYAYEGRGWITDFHPEEDEEEGRFAISESLEQAEKDWGEVGPADEMDAVRSRRSSLMPFATDKLSAYAEQQVDLPMVLDMLALVYAEQVLDLDGLFWDETLDVDRYSAPRGGLLRGKLSSWTIKKARKGTGPNEEDE